MLPGYARNWITVGSSSTIQPQHKNETKRYDNSRLKKINQPVAFAARLPPHSARARVLCAFTDRSSRYPSTRRTQGDCEGKEYSKPGFHARCPNESARAL